MHTPTVVLASRNAYYSSRSVCKIIVAGYVSIHVRVVRRAGRTGGPSKKK